MKMRYKKKLFKPVYKLRPKVRLDVIDKSTIQPVHKGLRFIFCDKGPR